MSSYVIHSCRSSNTFKTAHRYKRQSWNHAYCKRKLTVACIFCLKTQTLHFVINILNEVVETSLNCCIWKDHEMTSWLPSSWRMSRGNCPKGEMSVGKCLDTSWTRLTFGSWPRVGKLYRLQYACCLILWFTCKVIGQLASAYLVYL